MIDRWSEVSALSAKDGWAKEVPRELGPPVARLGKVAAPPLRKLAE